MTAAAITAAAGCGTPSPANPLGKTTHGKFASGTAAGSYAVAQAAGSVNSPSRIQLRLVANPEQSALVSWTMTCNESSGGVGNKSGQSTLQLSTIETLPMPARSDHCIVSSNAQLHGSGNLTISLWNGSALPVPSASPTTATNTSNTATTTPTSTTTTTAPGATETAPSGNASSYGGVAPASSVGPATDQSACPGLAAATVGPNTSCSFAANVVNVVRQAYATTGHYPAHVTAHSPATGGTYVSSCNTANPTSNGTPGELECSTGTGAEITIALPLPGH